MHDYINCFRNVRHPNIRGGTIIYEGETIQWKGHRLDICIYDKLKEKGIRFQGTGTVRAEVRLRRDAKRIANLCKEVLGGKELDFEKCYNEYRKILCQLEGNEIEKRQAKGAYAALAYIHAHGLTDQEGRPIIEYAKDGMSRSGQHKMIRRLQDLTAKYKLISFRKLLPKERMPETVNVYADGISNPGEKVA